jgi:thioredoxin 1
MLLGISLLLASGCMFKRNSADKTLASKGLDRQAPLAPEVSRQHAVQYASEATFEEQVLRSPGPVVVDFYAEWCGPCKKLGPVLEEFAAENPGAKVVKVNIDQSPQLAARYGVKKIPAVIVFKNGTVGQQNVGLTDKAHLKTMLGS